MLLDPCQVLFTGRGIDHQPEEILTQEIDDQIVDHSALGIEHARIQRLALHLELVDGVGQQLAQERPHVVATQVDNRHVADVEHAGLLTHQMMLVNL